MNSSGPSQPAPAATPRVDWGNVQSTSRALVDDALRNGGNNPSAADRPWTACRAPLRTLVIDKRGELRACDYADRSLCASKGALWSRAWRGGDFARLRASLAEGRLPIDHCRSCAAYFADDLLLHAPATREYGNLVDTVAAERIDTLVVWLPDEADLEPTLIAQLMELLPELTTFVLGSDTPLGAREGQKWLKALRRAPLKATVKLALRELGPAERLLRTMDGLRVAAIDWTATSADPEQFATARELASKLEAQCTIRFVLDPSNWFEFEQVALAATAHGLPLVWRLVDRNGVVPLAQLVVEDLIVVKAVVASAWERFSEARRPGATSEHAFAFLLDELRALLARRLGEPEVTAEPTARLALPAPDHPWFHAPELSAWWSRQLLTKAEHPRVRAWLRHLAQAPDGLAAMRASAVLRACCQQLAAAHAEPEMLNLLGALYRPDDTRDELLRSDREFEATIDLREFGGPWACRLGLLSQPERTPAFAIPAPPEPDLESPSDVTVLVPSFRHGPYIRDTLRSVLAQSHRNFRLLVVDDCSPDDTVAQARSIVDPRLEVRCNEANVGLGNSVLRALEDIDTPYVALLNSDDLFHPDRLDICCRVLDQDSQAQLVATGLALIDPRGGQLSPDNVSLILDGKQVFDLVHWLARALPDSALEGERLFEALLEKNFLSTSSNLVARTDWLKRHTATLASLKYCLDWQLFLDAARARTLRYVPQTLIGYRLHSSNTVWFLQGNRWSFYLEVNRVLATALQLASRGEPSEEEGLYRLLRLLRERVANNREADGIAMLVNTIFDARTASEVADASPRVQEGVRVLANLAQGALTLRDQADSAPPEATLRQRVRRSSLGDLAQEALLVERGRNRSLKTYVDSLERRILEMWAVRGQLEAEKRAGLSREADQAQRIRTLTDELFSSAQGRRELLERERGYIADVSSLKQELHAVRSLLSQFADETAKLRAEGDAMRAEKSERDLVVAAKTAELAHLHGLVAAQNEQAKVDAGEKRQLESALEGMTREKNANARQVDELRGSREFRTGNFIWNKLPLAYMSRRGKKFYNRITDIKERFSLWLGRRRHRAEGVAVVASCWHWPIYSHTFVYQEMISLRDMGLDVRMFHWEENDTSELQPAFGYLANHRTHIRSVWESHFRDKEHYENAKPGRLEALLQRISAATGVAVEELGKHHLVLQACTFARMAELAGARYIHSYFFYDQTFMAMVAAWLLEVPRGISCYADHMLDDFPFKLVDLQIELADVVVATSSRIKSELSAKSGGKFDDRIIVKPNGVDGRRFPLTIRPRRTPADIFEIVSVSRIEPKKGLEYLVEAVANLVKQGRRVVAHVIGAHDPHQAGSLEYSQRLRNLIAQHGLEKHVLMHGKMVQEQILPILQKSRAFVAPYVELTSGDKDGIPTAMLEAMAAGLPVVTTDAGSILEVVQHGAEALVVPQRDGAALANALNQLISDPDLEERLAKAARARFDRQFDTRVTEKTLHARVAELLGRKGVLVRSAD